jgi:uncharacterized protein (UPF0332 family)
MLDNKRIKEAEENVRSYLKEGLIRKMAEDRHVMGILRRNSEESLRVAEELYGRGLSDLWAIVTSYYSMYYIANAVLLKYGYKVGDKIVHKVTSDAMIVYVRNRLKSSLIEGYEQAREEALDIAGMKADSIIESLDFERRKRHFIQYETVDTDKRSKAKTSIQRAKEFWNEMDKLLHG